MTGTLISPLRSHHLVFWTTSSQKPTKISIMIEVLHILNEKFIVYPACLVLTKTDYQNAVYDFKMNQRNKRFNFLQSVKFF